MSITVEVKVVGMTCGHCVNAVTEEVSAVAGVDSVNVDLESGQVTITSDTSLDLDEVEAAIAEAGYSVA
ncbi:MAG: heavy metal-associated domain-containing protein [Actinobacteria bacterium]|nr:heavy metal-associated domain-containing protein [Actinomycetota bacterium]